MAKRPKAREEITDKSKNRKKYYRKRGKSGQILFRSGFLCLSWLFAGRETKQRDGGLKAVSRPRCLRGG